MELIHPRVHAYREDARLDPEGFWAREAGRLPWFRAWERVFEWTPPTFRWYLGGRTNIAYNCLDRHVQAGRGGMTALVYENERGESRTLNYAQLLAEVERLAAALRGVGVGRGDRVGIYLPTGVEAIAAMLACARIGAIHVVVFAGFGANALGDRLGLAGCTVLLTCDVTFRKGRDVPLKGIVDAALEIAPGVGTVVVLRRGSEPVPMTAGRDLWWEDFLAAGSGRSAVWEEMEANDPLYILATSGTTAKPKLAVHTHGPHQVWIHSMADWMFGLGPQDIWWSTSDVGWVVGHSYIVYAPLLVGCATIAYEGALDHPDPAAFYRICARNRVSAIFTSPTAARLLMRYGAEAAAGHDLSAIERVFCAGEVLNAPAWEWLARDLFQGRVPVIDHYWQTETAGPVVGNPYGLGLCAVKPGSAGVPLPGIQARLVTPDGEEVEMGDKGIFVIERPFPGLIQTLWGDPERYARDYWDKVPGRTVYFSGDSASLDEDGYVWFSGRADEIIKVAGHRIGTIEVETAFLRHPAVAEAGVTGRPDDLRGEVISAFVVLRPGRAPDGALRQELLDTVRAELGAVAVIGELNFVASLPKTRSGKIMRRVLKAVTLGTDAGDISTIEEAGSVQEAREALHAMKAELSR